MAEKEYLLGNRARELLRYTNQVTRVVSDDVSLGDVQRIIRQIAELSDIRDVQSVCSQIIHSTDKKKKEGFSKSKYRLYGEELRMIAKGIVRDIHSANNKHFLTKYQQRLDKIDDILDGCSLMLEYIQICLDEGIINLSRAETWTKKVNDVKFMSTAWRKNDGGRAAKLDEAAQVAVDQRQYSIAVSACRDAIRAEKQGY